MRVTVANKVVRAAVDGISSSSSSPFVRRSVLGVEVGELVRQNSGLDVGSNIVGFIVGKDVGSAVIGDDVGDEVGDVVIGFAVGDVVVTTGIAVGLVVAIDEGFGVMVGTSKNVGSNVGQSALVSIISLDGGVKIFIDKSLPS